MSKQKDQLLVCDYDIDIFEQITELAAKNKSTKEIRKHLNLNGRSFLKAFRDKESDVYLSFKRGIDQMRITKEDALIQKIEEKNLTAIEIHDKHQEASRFQSAIYEVFGI